MREIADRLELRSINRLTGLFTLFLTPEGRDAVIAALRFHAHILENTRL
jgi:Trp operon repressor